MRRRQAEYFVRRHEKQHGEGYPNNHGNCDNESKLCRFFRDVPFIKSKERRTEEPMLFRPQPYSYCSFLLIFADVRMSIFI